MARLRSGLKGIPRGAIAIIAFGLFLTVVCTLLTNTDLVTGESLSYESSADIPDSKAVKLGSNGEIQVTDAGIDVTRANGSGYRVYRVKGTLNLSTDEPSGPASAKCDVTVPAGVIYGQTPERRAAFPNPSEDLSAQPVPDLVVVEFNAKGTDVVQLATGDTFNSYTTPGDVLVDWGDYAERDQSWKWTIRPGQRQNPMKLGFIVMWRSADVEPAARIKCTAGADGAEATTATNGALSS